MGFERPERTVVVEFDESTDWHGAEVVCRRDISVRRVLRLARLAEIDSIDDMGAAADLFDEFAERVIVRWNLEENGEPVPVTGDAMQEWGLEFCMWIVGLWLAAVRGVAAPLVEESTSGEPLEPEPSGVTVA